MAIEKLCPFKIWTLENFPFIEDDFDAITNYELLCKIIEYLKTIGASQQEVINAVNALQAYVYNYFKNLDVQEEINNKLDEMAESGELMQMFSIFIPFITPEMFGAVGDGETDDKEAFEDCIENASINNKEIYLSNKTYYVSAFDLQVESDLNITGHSTKIINSGELVIEGDDTHSITVKDIEVNSGTSFVIKHFKNVEIENVKSIEQNKFGLLITYCENINVNNSKFIKNGPELTFSEISNKGMGLFLTDSDNVNVSNCYFEENHGQGALRISACDNLIVDSNTFINNMFRAIELPSVDSDTFNYNGKISNNYISGCGYQNINPTSDEGANGIFANGADGYVDVINNIILNSQENGIEGYFRHIKGNVIDGTGVGTKPTTACSGASVRCRSFENNLVKNTLKSGISAGGNGANRSNCSICNNVFENIGDKAGIYYSFTSGGGPIENLTIFNNTCNNRPIIAWDGGIQNVTLTNIKIMNNKGIGLPVVATHSVLPIIGYDVLDDKDLVLPNNRMLNWTETEIDNWEISANGTVTKDTDENDVICKIAGIAYNTYISQEFELDDKLNETLYELTVKFKGSHIQYYLENENLDGTTNTVYQNEYTSPDSSEFVTYKLCFRPYNTVTTGKLNFKMRSSGANIEYKEISLRKFTF